MVSVGVSGPGFYSHLSSDFSAINVHAMLTGTKNEPLGLNYERYHVFCSYIYLAYACNIVFLAVFKTIDGFQKNRMHSFFFTLIACGV